MIIVAVSLLPVLGLMLYAMDRIEEGLHGGRRDARHARARHLRLVHSASRSSAERVPAGDASRRADAA